jgi:hypothetical protein
MSFILDALRKIDRERPAQGPNAGSFTGATTTSRDEARHRREVAVTASVAVASALLTAVAFTLVSRSGVQTESPSRDAALAPAALPSQTLRLETRELPPVPRPREEAAEIDVAAPATERDSVAIPDPVESKETESRSHSETDPTPEPEGEMEDPSPGFPQLVLQGTSFINGIAVAVISDRRVFEGDTIEGAVVIRIDERSVELEFEGHRFTISL